MSKLEERIRRTVRSAPAQMGFTAAVTHGAEATMLAVVGLSQGEMGKIGDAAKNGADVIIAATGDAGKLKRESGKAGGALIGAALERASRDDVAAMKEAGADFVALELDSAKAESMLEKGVGFVLSVPLDADDTDVRILGDLQLDALIVPKMAPGFSVRELMRLRRIAALGRTPLLMEVDAGIDGSTLQALRESGVVGAIVDGSSIGKLDKLQKTIAGLPPRGHRREEKAEATIPVGVGSGEDEDWDEDEF